MAWIGERIRLSEVRNTDWIISAHSQSRSAIRVPGVLARRPPSSSNSTDFDRSPGHSLTIAKETFAAILGTNSVWTQSR